MSRLSRRTFLQAAGIACTTGGLAWAAPSTEPRRKLAIVTTEWRYGSHAWHMGERFLVGYPREGRWYRPPLDVVSGYVDQRPENDLSRVRAAEFGSYSDYSLYDGWRLRGWPRRTIVRGVTVMRDGEIVAPGGTGRFLARTA